MNLDDHWLKEHFKNESTESLEGELLHLEIFGIIAGPIAMVKAELSRRERETHEKETMERD
jgi:hypothetical protein